MLFRIQVNVWRISSNRDLWRLKEDHTTRDLLSTIWLVLEFILFTLAVLVMTYDMELHYLMVVHLHRKSYGWWDNLHRSNHPGQPWLGVAALMTSHLQCTLWQLRNDCWIWWRTTPIVKHWVFCDDIHSLWLSQPKLTVPTSILSPIHQNAVI